MFLFNPIDSNLFRAFVIFTEFGSFTVGESGGAIYEVLYQKQQNDREKWNMINSSFITTLPDTWAISKRFIMLPVNRWDEEYERVLLGGLTCDSDDYYKDEDTQFIQNARAAICKGMSVEYSSWW